MARAVTGTTCLHPSAEAGITVSASSAGGYSLLDAAYPAPAQDCACLERDSITLQRKFKQFLYDHRPVDAAATAAGLSANRGPKTSQAHSSEDPATVATTVGSAAQQLMSLALQVTEGGHSLEALEVITLCFEK